jgi:hypothetical protein
MKPISNLTISLALCGLALLGMASCHERKEGGLEKLGREVDDTISDAKEDKKSVGDKVGEAVRDLGDSIEDRN